MPPSDSACGMPVPFQIERLRAALVSRFGPGFEVVDFDLYALEGTERDAALDAVVAGEPSPFVLARGSLICTGEVEVATVIDALAQDEAPGPA